MNDLIKRLELAACHAVHGPDVEEAIELIVSLEAQHKVVLGCQRFNVVLHGELKNVSGSLHELAQNGTVMVQLNPDPEGRVLMTDEVFAAAKGNDSE
jgi:hypothetical protein